MKGSEYLDKQSMCFFPVNKEGAVWRMHGTVGSKTILPYPDLPAGVR